MANDANETFGVIKAYLEAGIPTLITGDPGTGKTAWIYDLKKQKFQGKEVRVHSMIASNRESTDIGGYPVPNLEKGVVEFLPVDWAVAVKKDVDDGYFTIVFIDEVRDITPPVFAALNKVVHERRVGEFKMPDEVRFIGAANSIETSTVGISMPPPSANRWAHVPWNMTNLVSNWLDGMIRNLFALQTPLAGEALERLPKERAEIAAFIYKRMELIHKMPQGEDERDGPWPSPRTLDYTAHAWAAYGGEDLDMRMRLMAPCVSHYVAAEFVAWRREMNLPDPELVLKGEIKDIVAKDRPDITYATMSSVVSCVASRWTGERFKQAWQCFDRVAKDGAADIVVALIPTLERTTDGRSNVPDVDKYMENVLPILARANVNLR